MNESPTPSTAEVAAATPVAVAPVLPDVTRSLPAELISAIEAVITDHVSQARADAALAHDSILGVASPVVGTVQTAVAALAPSADADIAAFEKQWSTTSEATKKWFVNAEGYINGSLKGAEAAVAAAAAAPVAAPIAAGEALVSGVESRLKSATHVAVNDAHDAVSELHEYVTDIQTSVHASLDDVHAKLNSVVSALPSRGRVLAEVVALLGSGGGMVLGLLKLMPLLGL